MLVFEEGKKLEDLEKKTLRARMRINNKLDSHMTQWVWEFWDTGSQGRLDILKVTKVFFSSRNCFQGSCHFRKEWLKCIKRYGWLCLVLTHNLIVFYSLHFDNAAFVSQVKQYINSCLKFNENLNVRYCFILLLQNYSFLVELYL